VTYETLSRFRAPLIQEMLSKRGSIVLLS